MIARWRKLAFPLTMKLTRDADNFSLTREFDFPRDLISSPS